MKATLKTIYHETALALPAEQIVFGYHARLQAGIYPAIGFSFDSKAHALSRAIANLYNLIERHEGTNKANAYYQNINSI